MAWAFRNATTTTPGSGGALSINKPSGVVDGDLLVVLAYLESDTNSWSGIPSGWNTDGVNLKIANTGAFFMQLFWKIASGEGASWTWTPNTNAWRVLTCAAYSGATGAGSDRVETQASAQGDGQILSNQTAPSVTTSTDECLVVFGYGNFSGTVATTTTGFCTNRRADSGGCCIADAVKSPAGSTGTSRPNAGPGTEDYAALHAAFKLNAGAAERRFFLMGH